MLSTQTLECFPVHAFGFETTAVNNTRLPFQFIAKSICSPCCPVIIPFTLTGVGQLVAVAAGKNSDDEHDIINVTVADEVAI